MKKDICRRIARLALIVFALCGAVFGALFLRGVYYVQPNADNWRLLPYIVPAAHYEQWIFTITTPEGALQTMDVSITCRDAQGREIRGITLHEGDLLHIIRMSRMKGTQKRSGIRMGGITLSIA